MNTIKVENMFNPDTGRDIPNQFRIYTNRGVIFQSYKTIIAEKIDGKVYLDKNAWNYSRTTSKWRNIFLNTDTPTTKARIKSGEYILVDLNPEEVA